MKSNKTYLYLVIFVVLIVAAYFLTVDRGDKTTSYKLSEDKFFELDSVKADRIEIMSNGQKVVLSKASGEWRLTEPKDYRVLSAYVENAVSNLSNMKIESMVSKNPEKKESFGFDETNTGIITVFESGNKISEFLIGNTASSTGSFVKKPDSDNIYLAENLDRTNFIKTDYKDWMDKNIISIPKPAINSVEIIMPGESFTVVKDTSGNFVIGSDPAGKSFDGYLNLLENLQTTGFSDTTLTQETDFTDKIVIDWGTKTELNLLKLEDSTPAKYLLKVTGDNQIYELEESYVNNLLKAKKDLLL